MPIYDTGQETAIAAFARNRFSISVAASTTPRINNHNLLVVLGYASASGAPSLISADFGSSQLEFIETKTDTATDVVMNVYYGQNVGPNSRAINFEFDRSCYAVVNVIGFSGEGYKSTFEFERYKGNNFIDSPKWIDHYDRNTMCVMVPVWGGSLISNSNIDLFASDSDTRVYVESYVAGGLNTAFYQGNPKLNNVSSGPANGFVCCKLLVSPQSVHGSGGEPDEVVVEEKKEEEVEIDVIALKDEIDNERENLQRQEEKRISDIKETVSRINETVAEFPKEQVDKKAISLKEEIANEAEQLRLQEQMRINDLNETIQRIQQAMAAQVQERIAAEQAKLDEYNRQVEEQRKVEQSLIDQFNESERKRMDKERKAEEERRARMIGRSQLLSILRNR